MGPARTRAARLVCVLAVLIGLFGMHGLAMQASGCHGAEGTSDTVGMVGVGPMMPSMPAVQSASGTATAHGMIGRATGSSCVFVPPTVWAALGLVLVAIVAAGTALGARSRRPAGWAGRSPPRSGLSLLLRVCVSRT